MGHRSERCQNPYTDDREIDDEEAHEFACDDVITNLRENWDLEEVK